MLSTELAAALLLPHLGPKVDVTGVTSADGASAGCLCFGEPRDGVRNNAIWVTSANAETAGQGTVIVSQNPRLDFIRALRHLQTSGHFPAPSRGSIATSARIHPSAVVREGAEIGPDCEIGPGAVIHASVRMGARVAVGASSVLGHDGFGYQRQANGRPLHFPHLGALVIEDDVAVGNLCSISRGTLDDTRIGKHTKIDDQVYVAHNVVIEDNVLVMSGVRLNGRVHIGAASWLGTGALVREGRIVGQGATVGMGSVVVAAVAAGQVVAGNPARVLR
jgi:acetyltransferase-like isoleucine patch superfamily enzyme